MKASSALEYRSDLFVGFYLGGSVTLARFAWDPSQWPSWRGKRPRPRPSRVERSGDRAYAVLDAGVAVRLA